MRTIGLFAGLLLVPLAARAEADSKKIEVAVMDLKGSAGIPAELMQSLTALVPQELDRLGPFKVITAYEIKQMLQHEQTKQQLGCDDMVCLSEIGGALGVELLVSGSITLVADTYLIQLQLMNIVEGKAEGRAAREYKGGPRGLLEEVRLATKLLVRDVLAAESGTLRLAVSEEGATIKIDGTIVGVSPMEQLSVAGGMHTVEVEKAGFVRFRKDVEIEAAEATEIAAALSPSQDFLDDYRERSGMLRTLAWTGVAAGAGMVVTGIITMVVGSTEASALADQINDHNDNPTQATLNDIESHKRDVAALDVVTMVMWGVGAATLATGLVLYFIGGDPGRYDLETSAGVPARAGLRLGPGGLTLVAEF